ncbi:serine/threonine-protein phosphatase 7 long form homolog [Arachis stenosperma]|uniref:serine/threonine-protein phosphatase 7 long form homolog n=1 Tax=Arachis stenosperma TaxID=217475 RepID=UPI0025ABB13F|nr:serine/threonine-protein phosphatase 7 long form homolog [Arachis stenosperma]
MVENYLRSTGFYHISCIGFIKEFYPLLAALVQRRRPETHTFVLPVGEVTVTLEDVAHIFGLPIDGEPVSDWTDSSSDFLQSQSIAIFGGKPIVNSSSKSLYEAGLGSRYQRRRAIGYRGVFKRYVRCQIFCLLGSTLFTNNSTAYAHAKYLSLLRDFERIHTYSWGPACLEHLYKTLCRASRYDTKEMDGALNLLFVWAWERLPCIVPVESIPSSAWLSKTIVIFRQEINYIDEFVWRPYEGLIIPDDYMDTLRYVTSLLRYCHLSVSNGILRTK